MVSEVPCTNPRHSCHNRHELTSPSVKPSEAHQIDVLTERAEVAEGLLAQYKDELKRRQDDIEDWQLRHRNLSRKYAGQRGKLMELQELVEYHLRREPVMDQEIYRMQNIQGFGREYWRLRNGS